MDFVTICERTLEKGAHKGEVELYPDFRVGRSKDLMVRGRSFYAIWDEEQGLWSTDEYDVQRLVDAELNKRADAIFEEKGYRPITKYLGSFNTNSWSQFRKFLQNISDSSHPLDNHMTFADDEVKKTDYVSKRLPYSLAPGDYSAWDELVGTLYNVEERAKIEWAIGAVVSGDARKIQKFLVLYGPAGTGKSTVLNIVQSLFGTYVTTFDAKALGSSSAAFATEVFKNNPLVAIQHDGDLSKIEDNTKLNSIISHEDMPMNEKYKPGYTARVNAFLFMGTNLPVKISDAKSGIIRRLIDVHPTGVMIPTAHYHVLMNKIDFELGAIAHHCLETYLAMGKNYYSGYRPVEMMYQTDIFFNFIEAHYDIFKAQDCVTLRQAYVLYKEFCADTGIDRVLPQFKIREELRNYFDEYHDRGEMKGLPVRSLYSGFNANKFKQPTTSESGMAYSLVIEDETSLIDEMLKDEPAQLANAVGTPAKPWARVKTKLSDLDTSQLHYVKLPENHIVIDFDLKDETGEKSLDRNLEAASLWPATYAEFSQGGSGIHLHYIYSGDVTELSTSYSDGIEVKTLLGDASLRRRLSKCNRISVATLHKGALPVKEKKMLGEQTIKSERGLRDLIARNLRKEIHPHTKPSVDFIHKILEDAYKSGMTYDVTDLRPKILAFANNSGNQALMALKVVKTMKWASEAKDDSYGDDPVFPDSPTVQEVQENDKRLAFYDIEVYPNLFVICWKFAGDANMVTMINPSAQDVEMLFKLKLVGFNNRKYDNHILYAAYMGYDNAALYDLSQKIINNERQAMFGEAYNLSYADIYDFSSVKASLKKFQIILGIHHVELDIPWDQPVPKELWEKVCEYCRNDVASTEAVFEDRKQDFVARQILSDLSGLSVNNTTQRHTAQILFGGDRNPQRSFVYTKLSERFPGYVYDFGKSSYRGEDPSEGGYVYAQPGIYHNVGVLDVASMHPTSIIELNLFGDDYTPKFKDLLDARIAIKRKDYDAARRMLDGRLAPHLENVADAKALSYALKIVINIVYGLTSAKFDNPFRDIRNVDNIVAKRGALFMIDLKKACEEKGWTVVHIKTDSIKLADMTDEMKSFVTDFGKQYGYDFEHEATYERFCLVNDAVYIAKYGWSADPDEIGKWTPTGAQFQHPYVFKKLFSDEEITFNDMCETRQVSKGKMYIERPDGKMIFVGKTGRFTPIRDEYLEHGGGQLWRVAEVNGEEKKFAVTGTKGYSWIVSEVAETWGADCVETRYFEDLAQAAIDNISKFGSYDEFVGA